MPKDVQQAEATATHPVRAFAATTRAPSVTTLKGIGTLYPDDPNFPVMLGMHGTKGANLAVQACDLLVAVGARFDDRVTGQLKGFAPRRQGHPSGRGHGRDRQAPAGERGPDR